MHHNRKQKQIKPSRGDHDDLTELWAFHNLRNIAVSESQKRCRHMLVVQIDESMVRGMRKAILRLQRIIFQHFAV